MFFDLPDPDPSVRGMAPDPDPCFIMQIRKTLILTQDQSLAIPVTVNGANFGKTIFSKYKGVIYDLYKNVWPSLKISFAPRSLKTARNNLYLAP